MRRPVRRAVVFLRATAAMRRRAWREKKWVREGKGREGEGDGGSGEDAAAAAGAEEAGLGAAAHGGEEGVGLAQGLRQRPLRVGVQVPLLEAPPVPAVLVAVPAVRPCSPAPSYSARKGGKGEGGRDGRGWAC